MRIGILFFTFFKRASLHVIPSAAGARDLLFGSLAANQIPRRKKQIRLASFLRQRELEIGEILPERVSLLD
jgi:hypothetical protein